MKNGRNLLCMMAFFLCSQAVSAFAAEESVLLSALKHLKDNETETAYRLLSSIPPESSEYPYAFEELQKLHYRSKAWDKFFGYAVFYRQQLMSKFFDPKLLLLETLALAKHCEFDAARKVLEIAEANLSEVDATKVPSETLRQIQSTKDLFALQSKFKSDFKVSAVAKRPVLFSETLFWDIPGNNRQEVLTKAVKSPRALRVYVKNSCGDPSS